MKLTAVVRAQAEITSKSPVSKTICGCRRRTNGSRLTEEEREAKREAAEADKEAKQRARELDREVKRQQKDREKAEKAKQT